MAFVELESLRRTSHFAPIKEGGSSPPRSRIRAKHLQIIAHRGYSCKYPENTMRGFNAAVDAGAHALETDVHLSSDGVIVLSHDSTLKRCFGVNGRIIDHDWSYLQTLRTLQEPHEAMPRLLDLLRYLAAPDLKGISLLVDIKADNALDAIIRLIAETLQQAPSSFKPWQARITLGCWAAEYIPLCNQYLPGFPITHIGFDISYARQFLRVPEVSFTIFQKTLVWPPGRSFLRDVYNAERPTFVWTVNDIRMIRWSICNQVDGIITDDPANAARVCAAYDGECYDEERWPFRDYLGILGIGLFGTFLGTMFRWWYGFKISHTWRSLPRVDHE